VAKCTRLGEPDGLAAGRLETTFGVETMAAGKADIGAIDPPFEIMHPAAPGSPAVFDSPHSGRVYPADFIASSRLDRLTLRRSEDCYIDELFAWSCDLGAPLLMAHFPRAYLDVNREPCELDPAMFMDRLPAHANTASPRVAGGLGTIPRIVCEHEEIYRWPLRYREAEARIERLYRPYHAALAGLMDAAAASAGWALLIDCHSMPSSAAPQVHRPPGGGRADIVLGDRYAASCDPAITGLLDELFAARGLRVARNKPYAGGYITQTYGQPRFARHAVQVEVNRGLYINERHLSKSAGFERLRQVLAEVFGAFLARLPQIAAVPAIAAE
jgi:N-formylglutamate amidohydrolase